MAYSLSNDRNSGGYFGDEESPISLGRDSSEEEQLPSEAARIAAMKFGRRTGSRTRSNPDEMDELCF